VTSSPFPPPPFLRQCPHCLFFDFRSCFCSSFFSFPFRVSGLVLFFTFMPEALLRPPLAFSRGRDFSAFGSVLVSAVFTAIPGFPFRFPPLKPFWAHNAARLCVLAPYVLFFFVIFPFFSPIKAGAALSSRTTTIPHFYLIDLFPLCCFREMSSFSFFSQRRRGSQVSFQTPFPHIDFDEPNLSRVWNERVPPVSLCPRDLPGVFSFSPRFNSSRKFFSTSDRIARRPRPFPQALGSRFPSDPRLERGPLVMKTTFGPFFDPSK